MADTIIWTGRSGKKYTYWIADIGASMKNEPGNYMFIKKTTAGSFTPIYIGETSSLADRLNNPDSHHKRACTKREGATHLCAHTTPGGEKVRKDEERDLTENYDPPCND